MTDYYNEMPGKYKEEDVPKTLTERFRIDTANNADGKRMAGKDAAIQGVPFGEYAHDLLLFQTGICFAKD